MLSNEYVVIGEHTYGKPHVLRWADTDGKLFIGKYCSIAANVKIYLGGDHKTGWVTTYPFTAKHPELGITGHPASKGNVVIGNDVWIGNEAVILSGVSVGDGAVIWAGAVVSRNVEPYGIAVGNPAKVKRIRFNTRIVRDLLSIKWWDWPHDKVVRFAPLLCSPDINKFIEEALKCQE